MIWYLLYPFRGTTETPTLGPSHPLRLAFSRYGRYVARHVDITLLISVAVAAILIYPIPFLFTTDFTNGASNLPHHVWTVAQPLDYDVAVEPDVIMRSIWVHGSYMEALNRQVLLGALELQDELLGETRDFSPRQPTNHVEIEDPESDLSLTERDTFHVLNGLTNQSWFFHSPLLYWRCADDEIRDDMDIIATVNQRKTQSTTVNVTLRHSIVFSGKRFEDRRLLAADALVITLIHLRDSPVARQWERKAANLPPQIAEKWTVYPPDGRSPSSQLYEFQFRPLSTQDGLILALAYLLASTYFLLSLSKLRAVKSKAGLIVTVVAQIIVSIMSSFTVCAVFKLDLSRIPQAAYPLVVLSMSLENIFRLINAVILTPPDQDTSRRVGDAFGETAHIAIASSAQNVLILLAMSYVVSPSVSAFCVFAAVAIVFDFFYLSTFFLSVLGLDVRRMELSDALSKASFRSRRTWNVSDQNRPTWTEAMMQGKIAVSTRIAGTIVAVCFVLIAQWHFLENETAFRLLGRLLSLPISRSDDSLPKSSLLTDVHQARSPKSWLRLQDHETARDVIHVIKPLAHNYIARVFDPIVFVMKGADRMPHTKERPLLPAVYDFIHHQLTPFVVTVLFILAAVRLFTNYLLWGEDSGSSGQGDEADDSLLTVKSLGDGHILDVAFLVPSADGRLVSVGLDRLIRVWNPTAGGASYEATTLERPNDNPFPIRSLAFDDEPRWLAVLSDFRILLWDLRGQRWASSIPIDLHGERPEAFFFAPAHGSCPQTLVTVRRNGTMALVKPESGGASEWVMCDGTIACAAPLIQKSSGRTASTTHVTILTATKTGQLNLTAWSGSAWGTRSVARGGRGEEEEVQQIVPLPVLGAFVAVRRTSADLIMAATGSTAHSFRTEAIRDRSLRLFFSRRRLSQGTSALTSLTLAYTAECEDCVTQTYYGVDDNDVIWVSDAGLTKSSTYTGWLESARSKKNIKRPGKWEALPGGHIIGVRKLAPSLDDKDTSGSLKEGLRLRSVKSRRGDARQTRTSWEVWLMSEVGRADRYETRPLLSEEEEALHLLVSAIGPVSKVGLKSVAVGFGNTIKMISVGSSSYVRDSTDLDDDGDVHIGSRRRKAVAPGTRGRISPAQG